MFPSTSEFTLVILLAWLLLGATLWRYAWARRLAAIGIATQIGWVLGGEAYAITFLIAAIGVWVVAAMVHSQNPTNSHHSRQI